VQLLSLFFNQGLQLIVYSPKRNLVVVGEVAAYDGDAPAVAAAKAEAADDILDLRRDGLDDVTTTPALTLLAEGERGERGELMGETGDLGGGWEESFGELGRRCDFKFNTLSSASLTIL